jgi:hypothetical protein
MQKWGADRHPPALMSFYDEYFLLIKKLSIQKYQALSGNDKKHRPKIGIKSLFLTETLQNSSA